jgi:hypothetical protein
MDLQMFSVKASMHGTARGVTVPPEHWVPDTARPCSA